MKWRFFWAVIDFTYETSCSEISDHLVHTFVSETHFALHYSTNTIVSISLFIHRTRLRIELNPRIAAQHPLVKAGLHCPPVPNHCLPFSSRMIIATQLKGLKSMSDFNICRMWRTIFAVQLTRAN